MINTLTLGYWADSVGGVQSCTEHRLMDGDDEVLVRLTVARKDKKPEQGHPLDNSKLAILLAEAEIEAYQRNPRVWGTAYKSSE